MSKSPDEMRQAFGKASENGTHTFDWNLTSTSLSDVVKLVVPPPYVLPVVFVPGIMGSNLKSVEKNSKRKADLVWRLDKGLGGIPTKVAGRWLRKSPGERQATLHPDRVEVDDGGAVPKRPVGTVGDVGQFKARGWGEVGQTSYEDFLVWLENKLNTEQGYNNPYQWDDFTYTQIGPANPPRPGQPGYKPPKLPPGIPMTMLRLPKGTEKGHVDPVISDDLLKRARFRMPVYAFGYNWLASNADAADKLKERIIKIIGDNNRNGQKCSQVIVLTHSMGGLVARCCASLPDMADKIAGVVHGVMPALGAAVAYRRCKLGMWDEDWKAGLAIGNDGKSVTAVFAQAPGALQLLPNCDYRAQWLKVQDENGKPLNLQPVNDPYDDIYLRRDRWWGLVREEWLSPKNGMPLAWKDYVNNIDKARVFHGETIKGKYHSSSYVFYGDDRGDQASFETVIWSVRRGVRPDNAVPSLQTVARDGFDKVRDEGSNPLYVGGKTEFMPDYSGMGGTSVYESSYWELVNQKQDGSGDGTVPASSGKAPMAQGGGSIKQQFKLKGFTHEAAYRNADAQYASLYAIMKIAGQAKIPA